MYKIRQLYYVQKKFKIYILSIASHLHVRWEASNLWVTILLRERGQNVELNFVKKSKKSLSQIFFADCIWGLTSSKSFLRTQLICLNLAPNHPQSIHSSSEAPFSLFFHSLTLPGLKDHATMSSVFLTKVYSSYFSIIFRGFNIVIFDEVSNPPLLSKINEGKPLRCFLFWEIPLRLPSLGKHTHWISVNKL